MSESYHKEKIRGSRTYYPKPESHKYGDGFTSEHSLAVGEDMTHSNDEQADTDKPGVKTGPTDQPVATDGGVERDPKAVITVDWDAVENEFGAEVPQDARRAIEREGGATEYTLDKYGYKELYTTDLSVAINEHGRILHPERGPLSKEYVPLREVFMTTSVLQVTEHGADLNVKTPVVDPIKGADDISFADGLAELADAAEALDEQRDNWYKSPIVSYGSHGPDRLGNCYITVAHTDESSLRALDTSDAPVELEHILHWDERHHNDDFEEHYVASFRHERYYVNDGEADDKYEDEAAEIGLLGSNLGTRTSITATLNSEGYEYEQVDELTVRNILVDVYEYDKDGETRYVIEWCDRVKIDEIVWNSLVFDHQPDGDDVERAALIEEARIGAKSE